MHEMFPHEVLDSHRPDRAFGLNNRQVYYIVFLAGQYSLHCSCNGSNSWQIFLRSGGFLLWWRGKFWSLVFNHCFSVSPLQGPRRNIEFQTRAGFVTPDMVMAGVCSPIWDVPFRGYPEYILRYTPPSPLQRDQIPKCIWMQFRSIQEAFEIYCSCKLILYIEIQNILF